MNKLFLFTGGFDPVHSGHLAVIKACAAEGRVIIGLNSDAWLERKKGQVFMPIEERKEIMSNIKGVMQCIEFDDSDDTAIDAIHKVREDFGKSNKIIFVNGGDRTEENIPEMIFDDVEFRFGVGGNGKKNSSSWILAEWKHPTEKRFWGDSMTYHDSKQAKVKRLILAPGKSISMQYHNKRSEFWFVENGIGEVYTDTLSYVLNKHDTYDVPVGEWHQLENIGEDNLEIIEIQYGEHCTEEDIVRQD
jgi:cytidyltransferase-like protein